MQTVAGTEFLHVRAFDEPRVSIQHPDLLIDEPVGLRGVRHLCSCRKLDLDELQRCAGRRRDRTSDVPGLRISPSGLLLPPHQPHALTFGTSNEFRQRQTQRVRQLREEGRGRLHFPALHGEITLRRSGRLLHLGIGRAHPRTEVICLDHNSNATIITLNTGELIAEFTLDPTSTYQRKND
ncbi:hypothetical protein [Microbacterium sp. nov. GSS16]|uniref:hypothetical protein n=1 Tax=Microbacterium sp. nov. GSS16 TaxID=3019890 RepID=UPI0023065D80|nr:hypothetical protein [Microbacterium sp. nov. GSS16]WCD93078.1 hypothetical protein PGB26_02020 [Microbacterium sp. nov. GSS16]